MRLLRHFLVTCLLAAATAAIAQEEAPNILFAIADDWGFPHASAYGDPVVKTPNFDRIASEGALVHHAYVSSPSCTPSRGAILTGQWHWRLEGAANLWSVFPDRFETYQEVLKGTGYRTGVTGKERHVPAQEAPDLGGYPSRAIRTHDFLYIRNFRPDRWPNGTPNYEQAAYPGGWYADTDNGPTKTYMVEQRDRDAEHRRLYELSFGKRPAVELYDLRNDQHQQVNVADDPEYQATRDRLGERLMEQLRATGDPRATGGGDAFDDYPYLGGAPRHPSLPRQRPGAVRPPPAARP